MDLSEILFSDKSIMFLRKEDVMKDLIIIILLVLILGVVILYMRKEKKRGVTCIGCPSADTCAKKQNGEHCH